MDKRIFCSLRIKDKSSYLKKILETVTVSSNAQSTQVGPQPAFTVTH